MSGWSISQATTNSARGSSSSASSFNAYSALLRENPISTSCWIKGGVGSGGGVGLRVRAFFFCRCLDLEGFLVVDWGWGLACSGPWPFSGTAGVGGSAGRLASLARNWQAARAAASNSSLSKSALMGEGLIAEHMRCCKENVLLPSELLAWWLRICLRLSCLLHSTRAAFRSPRVICCCLNCDVSTISPT